MGQLSSLYGRHGLTSQLDRDNEVPKKSKPVQNWLDLKIYKTKKFNHKGPEETTYIEQGVGQHIEMITVNGWCEGGMRGVRGREIGR